MKIYAIALLLTIMPVVCSAGDKVVKVNPNQIQMNDSYVHEKLPDSMLKRIKATTAVFEPVDGISYEKAVDLYKRDLDPESNLIIWEEMARVYKKFCKSRCSTHNEKMDVYRALLLRSMYPESEAMAQLKLKVITTKEAKKIMSEYRIKAQPIDVMQK